MRTNNTKFINSLKIFPSEYDIEITNGDLILDNDKITYVDIVSAGELLKSESKKLIVKCTEDMDIKSIMSLQVGLRDEDGNFNYLSFGDFIITEKTLNEDDNTIEYVCYDNMIKFNINYEKLNIDYPITLKNYLQALCDKVGVALGTTDFTNSTREIKSELYDGLSYTYRDVLDEIAEAVGMCIVIDSTGALNFKKPVKTDFEIDEDLASEDNVKVGEKFGPVNSIVISRVANTDNIYRKTEDAKEDNLCELVISDNQILNDNDRDLFIDGIAQNVFGIEFYKLEMGTPGILLLEFLDMFTLNVKGNSYNCMVLDNEITFDEGMSEQFFTETPKMANIDYNMASKTDRGQKQTTLIVDKMKQQIEAKVSAGDVVASLNLEIRNGKGIVELTGNTVTIDSDNFTLDRYGRVTAHDLNLRGGDIVLEDDGTRETASIKIITPLNYYDNAKIGSIVTANKCYFLLKDEILENVYEKITELGYENVPYTLLESDGYTLDLMLRKITTLDWVGSENPNAIPGLVGGARYYNFKFLLTNKDTYETIEEDTYIRDLTYKAYVEEDTIMPYDLEFELPADFGIITKIPTIDWYYDKFIINTYSMKRETYYTGTSIQTDIVGNYNYTESDVERVNNIYLGSITPTEEDFKKYDTNHDGQIDLIDLTRILSYFKNNITFETPGKFVIDTTSANDNIVLKDGLGKEKINISLAEGIEVDGVNIFAFEHIWDGNEKTSTGGYYPAEGHIIYFPKDLSEYRKGLWLIWYGFDKTTAKRIDTSTTIQFIPKDLVLSGMVYFMPPVMTYAQFQHIGVKTIKVYSDRIEGTAYNTRTGTANGITYDNSYFILGDIYAE